MHFGFYITEGEETQWLNGQLSDFDLLTRSNPERVSCVYYVGAVKNRAELFELRRIAKEQPGVRFVFRTCNPKITRWAEKKVNSVGIQEPETDGLWQRRSCSLLSGINSNSKGRQKSSIAFMMQSGLGSFIAYVIGLLSRPKL
jgi:hypothetical protein